MYWEDVRLENKLMGFTKWQICRLFSPSRALALHFYARDILGLGDSYQGLVREMLKRDFSRLPFPSSCCISCRWWSCCFGISSSKAISRNIAEITRRWGEKWPYRIFVKKGSIHKRWKVKLLLEIQQRLNRWGSSETEFGFNKVAMQKGRRRPFFGGKCHTLVLIKCLVV